MTLYAGIDLHSNNSYVCVIDEQDRRILERRFANDAQAMIQALSPYRRELEAVAVESTFNWYWLADALMAAGFEVRLVNPAKVVQYQGLKRTDDRYDAFHLAHLMRLGLLPPGYMYPPALRGLRDVLRKRMQLVQDRTRHLLSFKTQYHRLTGRAIPVSEVKAKGFDCPVLGDANVQLALQSNLRMSRVLDEQVRELERAALAQVRAVREYQLLQGVCGIGPVLAQTILLETGPVSRFGSVGQYASYCRCVDSRRESNGRKKGENNRKNGNRYLAWAYMEAANLAVRHHDKARRFYQRKAAKTHRVVALKALAHKLARACYYILLRGVPFDENKVFV